MTIVYEIGKSLYINLTNKCTNCCVFCIRDTKNGVSEGLDLWLSREPSCEEIYSELLKYDLSKYNEIVFCGYGEPLLRLDAVLCVCKKIKKQSSIKIRINTNGQANLFYGKDISPQLFGLIDSVSISLNAKNAKEYDKICKSDYGEKAFGGMLDFAKKCKKYVPEVILSVVDILSDDDIKECKKIADDIGVSFRIRKQSL